MSSQIIPVTLKVGSRVSILTDVYMEDGGFAASTVFEDTVTEYNPSTKKLSFEDSDIGYARFRELLSQHDSLQVIKE